MRTFIAVSAAVAEAAVCAINESTQRTRGTEPTSTRRHLLRLYVRHALLVFILGVFESNKHCEYYYNSTYSIVCGVA